MKGQIAIPKAGRPHLKTVLITTKEGKTRWGSPLKLKPPPTNSIDANRYYCLRRDNYTCQQCGQFTTQPLVHHKDGFGYPKSKHPNHNPANLETLCPQCHMRLHYGIANKWTTICTLRDMGLTLATIGKQYKVSRQRIHQILNKPNHPILNASV